jgi:hypothetical protein
VEPTAEIDICSPNTKRGLSARFGRYDLLKYQAPLNLGSPLCLKIED